MIFPLNWVRRESAFIRHNFDRVFHAEWVHVIAHLVLFSGLVVLALLAFRLPQNGRTAVILTAILLAVAVVQEVLQLQVKTRPFGGPEWFDLGVDLVGGMIGWWVYGKFWGRRRLKQT
jgi:VanZ family protein